MKLTICALHGRLLTAGVLSLSATSALCQTTARRSVFSRPNYIGRSAAANSTYNPYSINRSANAYYAYPNYVSRRAVNAAQTGNTTQTSGTAANALSIRATPQSGGPSVQPQTATDLTAQYTDTNEILALWTGNTNGVQQVTLGLFDSNRTLLDRRVLTQPPFQTAFVLTHTARYYGVQVTYASGQVTTLYKSLP